MRVIGSSNESPVSVSPMSMKNCQSMAQSDGMGRKPPRSAASWSKCFEKMGRRSMLVFSRYWGRIIECPNR